MSLLCSDPLGFPRMAPVHLCNPSATDSGSSAPIFSMYVVCCLFFFYFDMKEAEFSIMVLQIQDVIQEHSEVQRAEQVLPFSKLDSEQHRLDKIHSNTVTRVETL